jgi:hypothetical protein
VLPVAQIRLVWALYLYGCYVEITGCAQAQWFREQLSELPQRDQCQHARWGRVEAIAPDLREVDHCGQHDRVGGVVRASERHEAIPLLRCGALALCDLDVVALEPARDHLADAMCLDRRGHRPPYLGIPVPAFVGEEHPMNEAQRVELEDRVVDT